MRTFSWLHLVLIILGVLPLAFNIQPAEALGPIYIRADGSVDPPTAPIQREGNIYTLTGNILVDSQGGIAVQKNDVVIDGRGYIVQGTESKGTGIDLTERSNVTIKNAEIKACEYGIRFYMSHSQNRILANRLTSNKFGILLRHSPNNTISGNNITANHWAAVWFHNASHNHVIGNNITAHEEYGIFLTGSSSNIIHGNNITANQWRGVYFLSSNHNRVSGNNVTSNNYGVHFTGSSNNVIVWNNITANHVDGIYLDSSLNNSIRENNIEANRESGIRLHESSNNTIYRNNFVNNFRQVYCTSWDIPGIAPSVNIWDDGFPSGGNHWSDYNGKDANYDGVGDDPYVIDEYNVDRYPLMAPIIIPEFPSTLMVLVFVVLTLVTVTFARRKMRTELEEECEGLVT